MDRILAAKLNPSTKEFDTKLQTDLCKAAQDYIRSGLQTLEYFVTDLDAANDMVQCYAPVEKADWERQGGFERNSPQNFIHPMAATEITTLATFISQILFGAATARRVEPRKDEDEKSADAMNELLQWNDDQQATYLQGYLWIWDALTFNRGVMYDHWQDIYENTVEEVEETDPTAAIPEPTEDNPYPSRPTYKRFRRARKKSAGFNKIELISPYDFIADPMVPILRFQEGRFSGHRVMIPWQELKRRSKLNVDDYGYVLPHIVQKLKNTPTAGGSRITNAQSQPAGGSRSRSFYERTRRGNPAGYQGGTEAVNKEDGGVIECFCIYVRIPPSTYNIFKDDEPEIIEFLMGGEKEILSINIMPNVHDQYPYAVGEARPNAHYQFGASWALIIKPLQDYVDYLKQRHQESLARTSGNIFIGDPTKVDMKAFTDPKKDGLFIPVTPEGAGTPLDQIIKQVPVQDTTAQFHNEMAMWMQTAEQTTGAHAFVQGKTDDPGQTATQFAGVQQMATGRISSLARILSVIALVPQTRRFVCNFQQFAPDEMTVRITGNSTDFDADDSKGKFLTVRREGGDEITPDIQAQFDIVPNDGSLPGTDARKVAAMSRAMEAFSSNPDFAKYFDDTMPGALNLKKLLYESLKGSGLMVRNFLVTKEQAAKNLQAKMLAEGNPAGQPLPGAQPGPHGATPPPMPVGGGMSIPGAGLPQQPTASPAPVGPVMI